MYEFVSKVNAVISQARIRVIGDTCHDIYYQTTEGRIIPGSTRAIDVVKGSVSRIEDGMASYVAKQIEALGAQARLITNGFCTIERYGDVVIRRTTYEPNEKIVLGGIKAADCCAGTIIADYNRGAITENVARAIDAKWGGTTFVDPGRGKSDAFYGNPLLIKRNKSEIESVAGSRRLGRYSLVTGGWRGMWLTDNESHKTTFIPAIGVDAIDSTGCGDVCIATICAFFMCGATMRQACVAGSVAAGLKATKQGCQVVSMQEICEVFEQWSQEADDAYRLPGLI